MYAAKLNLALPTTKLGESGNAAVISYLVEQEDFAVPFRYVQTPQFQQGKHNTLHFSLLLTANDDTLKFIPITSTFDRPEIILDQKISIPISEVEEFIHYGSNDSREGNANLFTDTIVNNLQKDQKVFCNDENFEPLKQIWVNKKRESDDENDEKNKQDKGDRDCNKPLSPMLLSDFEENIFYDEWKSSPLNAFLSAQSHKQRLLNDVIAENEMFFENMVTRDMPILTYPKLPASTATTTSLPTAKENLVISRSKYFINNPKPATKIINSDSNSSSKTITNRNNNQENADIPINPKEIQRVVNTKTKNIAPAKVNLKNTNINTNSNAVDNIIQKNGSKVLKDCSKKTTNVDFRANSVKSKARSRLFPTTMSVSSVPTKEDVRPALIVDEAVLSIPGNFQQIFKDCRVVFRKLKACDFEINDRCCVIFSFFNQQNKDYDQIETEKIVKALTMFETVFWVIIISIQNLKFIHKKFIISVPSLKIRQFPSVDSALVFVRSMVGYTQTFLRESETLHEHLLSLFPTISKSLANAILQKGNPIADCSVPLNDFAEMNIYPFNYILDAISKEYQKNKTPSKKSNKNGKYLTEQDNSAISSSFTPSIKKVKAPYPSSAILFNEDRY